MDLSTTYLGMKLKNPLIHSASPLAEEVDNIRQMEDSGAAAVVLHSLFEEQFRHEAEELHHHLEMGTESYANVPKRTARSEPSRSPSFRSWASSRPGRMST